MQFGSGACEGSPVAICLYECQTQRRFISVQHDSWVTGTAGTAVVLRSRESLKSLRGERTMRWEVWARMHSHSHRYITYIHRCKVGKVAFDAKLITVRGYWLSNTWTPMGRRPYEHTYTRTTMTFPPRPWSHHLSGRVKSQTELFFVERNLAWNKTFLSFLAVFMNQVFCPTIRVHSSSPLEMDTISGWMLSSAWDFKMICGQSQRGKKNRKEQKQIHQNIKYFYNTLNTSRIRSCISVKLARNIYKCLYKEKNKRIY